MLEKKSLGSLVHPMFEMADDRELPVISVSEVHGLVRQEDLFNKRVATSNTSKYLVVKPGDIVFNPYLLWNRAVGTWQETYEGCTSPAYQVLRPNSASIERFLHYFLRSPRFSSAVDAIASGSVTRRRTAPLEQILGLTFDLPSLDAMERLSELLLKMDELIKVDRDLSNRANLLSDALFLKWSMDVNAKVPFGSIAERPKRHKPTSCPEVPYIGLEHLSSNAGGLLGKSRSDLVGTSTSAFEAGDILYGKLRPYLRKVARPMFSGVSTSEAWVLDAQGPATQDYIYWLVRSVAFSEYAMSGSEGTKMPRASWQHVASMQVPDPSQGNLKEISAIANTLWRYSTVAADEASRLESARETVFKMALSNLFGKSRGETS